MDNRMEPVRHKERQLGSMHRRQKRLLVHGMQADVAASSKVFSGTVDDISVSGFKMSNVPSSFDGEDFTYVVKIFGDGKQYRLVAKPCWRRKGSNDLQQEVGFRIFEAPAEWLFLTSRRDGGAGYNDTYRVYQA